MTSSGSVRTTRVLDKQPTSGVGRFQLLVRIMKVAQGDTWLSLSVLVFYLLLTVAYTYPAALRWGEAIPGYFEGDTPQNVWNLWWVKVALLDLHQNPFQTAFIYYPYGVSLSFHTLSLANGLLVLPVTATLGPAVAYTAVSLVPFVLAGWGTFLLAREVIGRHTRASLLAGFIFAFSPYHFSHLLGVMHIASLHWLPFYALFFIRSLRRTGSRNPLLAALFFTLAALTSWYWGAYLAFFSLAYVLLAVAFERDRLAPGLVGRGAIAAGAMVLLLAPFVVPMIVELTSVTERYMSPGESAPLIFSADLAAFFKPSWLHPIWGRYTQALVERFSAGGAEGELFLGYGALGLAAWGTLRNRRRSLPWVVIAVSFLVLSLGPNLWVFGRLVQLPNGDPIPLPYRLLLLAPTLDLASTPSRLAVMTTLAVALLAAGGFAALTSCGRRRYQIIAGAGALIIAFEFWPAPIEMAPLPRIPTFYQQLAAETGPAPVMDVPVGWRWVANPYVFYQMVHHQPIVGGTISRLHPYPLLNSPFFREIGWIGYSRDIVREDATRIASTVLNHYGIRFAVFHKGWLASMPSGFAEGALGLLKNADRFGELVYEDEAISAVRVRPVVNAEPFIEIGDGWHEREDWQGVPTRWMGELARLIVVSPDERRATIELSAQAFRRERTLELGMTSREPRVTSLGSGVAGPASEITSTTAAVRTESEHVGTYRVGVERIRISAALPLRPGRNVLTLRAVEPPESPRSVGMQNDPRPLSVNVQNVELTEG